MEIVNIKIKELRESLNLSQEEFGKSIGLSKSGISNIEKGIRKVRDNYIELICTKYNISKEWLTTGDKHAKEAHLFESFVSYLKSLEYTYDCQIDEILDSYEQEEYDGSGNVIGHSTVIEDATYISTLSKDGITATFTQEEFETLQNRSKESIEGMILLQYHKNKKEPPSAVTENGSGESNENTNK
ncbi:MAG: helix-turn-helix transcriptional regulator [Eubacteriales bacterium]|nr:helix-turn-helix transcriptional regulator [Eubacteriales bacterium]